MTSSCGSLLWTRQGFLERLRTDSTSIPSYLVSFGPGYAIMEDFESETGQFLRRWLGLTRSFIGLAEEFKVSGARVVLLYKDS